MGSILRRVIIIILIIIFSFTALTQVQALDNLNYIRVPIGSDTVTKPVEYINMKVDVVFEVTSGSLKWSQPQGWYYVEKFVQGERRSTYYVAMSDLHLTSPNKLVVTFDIRMRVAPPRESAPFHPDWHEDMDLPSDLKRIAKAFAKTSETYFDYAYKVYDFVSNYIKYDGAWIDKDPKDINELWKNKRGVCRHYVMLMKAFLDYAGVESVYALGFLGFPSTSQNQVGVHMWIYVYDPDNGWILFDPTNNIYTQFTERGYSYTYPNNFPVKITDDYVAYIYLPIYDVDYSNVKEYYNVINYEESGDVSLQVLELKNEEYDTYFLRTLNAGNLIYVPVSYYEKNGNLDTNVTSILKQYNFNLIPEYIPEDYIIPMGNSPYSLISFYKDLIPKAEKVDFNKYFTIQYNADNGEIMFYDNVNSGLKPFLTDDEGVLINPIIGKNYYKYKINQVGKIDNLDLYLNVFGQLFLIKSFKIKVDKLTVKPIITIPSVSGFESVLKIQTEPDIGDKLRNYIVFSGATVEQWYDDNTVIVNALSDNITVTLGDKSVNVDLYDTGITITKSEFEFKNTNTVLHITYNKNIGELLVKYSLTPLYIRIGDKEYPITYTVNKNNVDVTASLTMEVFMNSNYKYYFITKSTVKDILNIDFTYTIQDLTANYDGSIIKITGTLKIKPNNFNFDEESFKEFSIINMEDFKVIGTSYKIRFESDPIQPSDFTLPYKFTINIFGKEINVKYMLNIVKPKISYVKMIKYQADTTYTKIYYGMKITYASANANNYLVNYYYAKSLKYVKINNQKYSAKYYPKEKYLIGVTQIPTKNLLKMSELRIFGIPVQEGVDYKTDSNYLEPKIIFTSLPLIGNMKCNTPYDVIVDNGNFELVFTIKSVYNDIECEINKNIITLKPEAPFMFTMNIVDTSRIDDVKDSRTVYKNYDGVFIVITTTTPTMSFRVEIDNQTIGTIQNGGAKIPLPPKLSVGKHKLSIYDSNNIEVYREYITIEPQPLSLKLLHNMILIIVALLFITLIIILKFMNKQDPLVEQAKAMFPNTEYLQKEQHGEWTYIYLMDDLRGEIITVIFHNDRLSNVTRNKIF